MWVSAAHVKGLFGAAPAEDVSSARGTRPAGTVNAAQAAYEAQLQALQAGADGDLDTRTDRRTSGGWWQESVAWEVWLGVALIVAGILYSVLVTPEHVRFPPTQSLNSEPHSHYFFGTGPWSTVEYGLLWF